MSQKSIRHSANNLCPGPPRVRLNYATKPCSVKAPTHGLTAIRNAILCLGALLAHFGLANCPVAYQGLKITTSLSSVSLIFSE
ncbi:hypothetical protein [Bathymodiolus japonicus methanotrophic gill symbiont]|uniref:hypothetical protein n=1 Tax=Bathymodiolus japonicus methanotrophic gill symbiont TaxID=113269 RepID=UPI001C8DFC63|nr:hypothetical protein [Bathymodiolus japonicus methanotrophic gill symbiont]